MLSRVVNSSAIPKSHHTILCNIQPYREITTVIFCRKAQENMRWSEPKPLHELCVFDHEHDININKVSKVAKIRN